MMLTEAEALAKASKLAAAIRAGADFCKRVREDSQDVASRAKDGDFGTWTRSDEMVEPIRAALFALKRGEVSDPVRQPNGFYLRRAEQISPRPLSEVSGDIEQALRVAYADQWLGRLDRLDRETKVEIVHPALRKQPTPARSGSDE